ncbi:DUF6629 family protein [Methylocystis sp. SC2]|uniref:DUF6629 family protein n=1 Tax=Methylocystis sp. (strain SC2) TaxID=187303 RepID=UPI00027AF178|nr:DUF6629 family protein [Methylocystis sp. SC2]CCJ05910.1 Conserved hypothetical protein [Methylocystis sp. SC2]
MCYSLEASITAGLGLGLAGYGMVSKALRHDRRMLLFAAFPLVFSAHQFVEAAVWLTRADPIAGQPYRYLYTLIAFTVWPVLTPIAAAYAESDPERRRLWRTMGGIGFVLAAYLTAQLAGADGIDLSVYRHSLAYDPLFERPPLVTDLLYLVLTVSPLVFSERRAINIFGAAVFLTFVAALAANRPAWYSVWCLAAAVFSLVIALGIEEERSSDFDELEMQR